MKRFLLLIICLFVLGSMTVQAQQSSADIEQTGDEALFKQTVEAIKNGKFVLKADKLYSKDENQTFTVNNQCNYLIMENDKAIVQVTNSDHIGFYEEHKVSDVKIKTDKKGNLLYNALLKDSRKAIRVKIKIRKDTNCGEAIFSSIKKSGNYILTGSIQSKDIYNVAKLY